MLAIPLDKLAFIIVKARQYDAEVPTTDPAPGSNPADDGERAVLEEGPANPTLQELAGAIDSLSELERVELLALVWLGRAITAATNGARRCAKPAAGTTRRKPTT